MGTNARNVTIQEKLMANLVANPVKMLKNCKVTGAYSVTGKILNYAFNLLTEWLCDWFKMCVNNTFVADN